MRPIGTVKHMKLYKIQVGKSSEVRAGMFTIGTTLFRREGLVARSQETFQAKS